MSNDGIINEIPSIHLGLPCIKSDLEIQQNLTTDGSSLSLFEPPPDKTNKMARVPSED